MENKSLECCFCGTKEPEAKFLIYGKYLGSYICDKCIEKSNKSTLENKLVNEKIKKLSGMVDENWLERNENFLKLVLLIPFGIASFLLNEGGEHRLALMVGVLMIFILASFFDTLVHGKNGRF